MSSTKLAVLSKNAPAPSPLMSQGIICNEMIYCSGSLGIDHKSGEFVSDDVADRTVSQAQNDVEDHCLSNALNLFVIGSSSS